MKCFLKAAYKENCSSFVPGCLSDLFCYRLALEVLSNSTPLEAA